MHPLQYQRPTAAPGAGNVAQAEKIVAALASAGALARRFATLADLKPLWVPPRATGRAGGAAGGAVFGHVETRQDREARAGRGAAADIEVPPITMTWEKFARTVLPEAEQIALHVPAHPAPYFAMVTAADAGAPPILQWDREEERNPVSMYCYVNGSEPAAWNLTAGALQPVTAITLLPWMWGQTKLTHHATGVVFVLEGCKDREHKSGGGLFPESLRSDYHAVRATMEAYTRSAVIAGKDEASACGLGLVKGKATWDYAFRVTSKGASAARTRSIAGTEGRGRSEGPGHSGTGRVRDS